MKIAYILDNFPVYSETFIVREILELQRKGFEVSIFALRNTKNTVFGEVVHADTQHLIDNVCYLRSLWRSASKPKKYSYHLYFLLLNPIKYIKTLLFSYRSGSKTFVFFINSVLLAMKFKRDDIKHIHAHFALDACTVCMLISMYTRIPYSFTVHAHDIFIPQLSEFIEEKFKQAKFSVSISEYNKNFVLNNYPAVNSHSIKVIHCGLYVSHFHRKKKDEKETFNILSIGRLVEHKGFKYLIEACWLLRKETKLNFVCKIVGGGHDRLILDKLIRRLHLDKTVHLLGALDQADIKRELTKADLFVLPCVVETSGMKDGIPVVLMEAMAMGIPVVSTSVSGIPELIQDGAGLLVEPRNATELAKAIKKICSLPVEERRVMARRGAAVVEKEFNLRKEAQKLAELIKNRSI